MAANRDLPSHISMIMLGVSGISESVRFYRDTLNLQLKSQSDEFAFFSTGGVTLVLSAPLGRAVRPPGSAVEVVFPVESVSETYALLTRRNCKFVNRPREVSPGSWAASFTDPNGHVLTLFGSK